MLIPYWPQGVITFLQIVNIIVALLMLINALPKIPLRSSFGYTLSEKGRKYFLRAWRRGSLILGAIVLIVNVFDPILATYVMMIGTIIITVYAMIEGEKGAIMDEVPEVGGVVIKPIGAARYLIYVNLIIALIPIITLILLYPYLPDVLVVHFDLNWKPNGWMNKPGFAASLIISVSMVAFLACWYSYLAWKKPEALLSRKVKDPSKIVLLPILLTVVTAIDALAFIYLIFYNLGARS